MRQHYVFGDWHGNTRYATGILRDTLNNARGDIPPRFVHCGDFGFFGDLFTSTIPQFILDDDTPYGPRLTPQEKTVLARKTRWNRTGFICAINDLLEDYGATLHVCLGNHENYDRIVDDYGYKAVVAPAPEHYNYPVVVPGVGSFCEGVKTTRATPDTMMYTSTMKYLEAKYRVAGLIDEQGFIVSDVVPNIKIIPRAHVWQWDGVTYASLGGATSIDAFKRENHVSWWDKEYITAGQMDDFRTLTTDVLVDVVITHDAPRQVVNTIYPEPVVMCDALNTYVQSSSQMVELAVENLPGHVHVCGHHHTHHTTVTTGDGACDTTVVEVLDCDGADYSDNRVEVHDLMDYRRSVN